MILAARGPARADYQAFLNTPPETFSPRSDLTKLWVFGPDNQTVANWKQEYIDTCLQVIRKTVDPEIQLEAIRLLQIGLGDLRTRPGKFEVDSGYVSKHPEHIDPATKQKIEKRLVGLFPEEHRRVNLELGRLFGMMETKHPRLIEAVADRWTPASSPLDDVHYLIVASKLPGKRSKQITDRTASMIVQLHAKLAAQERFPSRNWPLRVGEALDYLLSFDPALASAIVRHPNFGMAEHVMFTSKVKGKDREHAARRLLAAAIEREEEDQPSWTSALIRIIGELPPEESLPVLRRLWSDPGLRDGIALVLLQHRQPQDQSKLVQALSSPQSSVVSKVAITLLEMPRTSSGKQIAVVLQSLKQFCLVKEAWRVREDIVRLLEYWTKEKFSLDESKSENLLSVYDPWFRWFQNTHPDQAETISNLSGANSSWEKRFTQIPWEQGNVDQGKIVFEQKSCHRCHIGARRLGPALDGVASRFSRADLFASIIDPNKNISPAFQTTTIATKGGQVYTGLLVYSSPDGSLLQTGPDATIRVTGPEVLSRRRGTISLMPTGLLKEVSDEQVAHLYAYLKSLKK